jgi:hypothetical protein
MDWSMVDAVEIEIERWLPIIAREAWSGASLMQ